MNTESANIRALRERYRRRLVGKLTELDQLTEREAHPHQQEGEGGLDLAQYLHRLAGSSGMYGYQDISTVARAAMRDIEERNRQSLEQHLNRLRALLAEYSSG